ncbi:MAG: hypothetical protein J1F39_03495 [Clostridiales bacterium]|nr:hypothetical protein [Clostridiales bacterium]
MIKTNKEIKRIADRILYEFGLFDELSKIGVPHIIGSYKMDVMAANDVDIDVENDKMSLEKLHELTAFILKTFNPTWYEAKQEVDDIGNTVWFHGFEFIIEDELFNVDVWFFDREAIKRAENYYDKISSQATDGQKNTIIALKRELIARGLYKPDMYTSMHVYEAVLEKNVVDIERFLRLYKE